MRTRQISKAFLSKTDAGLFLCRRQSALRRGRMNRPESFRVHIYIQETRKLLSLAVFSR